MVTNDLTFYRAFCSLLNTFRNTRVAHVETKLDDPDEAWKAMKAWLRCLGKMAEIGG
jgi:hypothetical protein